MRLEGDFKGNAGCVPAVAGRGGNQLSVSWHGTGAGQSMSNPVLPLVFTSPHLPISLIKNQYFFALLPSVAMLPTS
jgi:hypothetical protein